MGLKGVDGVAGQPAPPRAIEEGGDATGEAAGDTAADAGEGADRMPGALESADGGSPEVTVHSERELAADGDLSPEEQAVHVARAEPDAADRGPESEDDDQAALAEGRVAPPVTGREGTA
jgi:hypothetical protein